MAHIIAAIIILFYTLHIQIVCARSLRTNDYCNKPALINMAKNLKSPNTMYHVVSVLSLKTGTPPHKVADCLGFIWKKNLDRNKYTINVATL